VTLPDDCLRPAFDHGLLAARLPDPAPPGRHWFADEVAIDFPSIGEAIERIRASFASGDPAEPKITAEVRLSPREALAGGVVPVVVPLLTACLGCGGRGEVWAETCPDCDGAGSAVRPRRVRVAVPARVSDGARFQFSVRTPNGPRTRIEVCVAVAGAARHGS
jgi:hypothetical protein